MLRLDDGDHPICYKDFDCISETLSEEKTINLKKDNGTIVPLGLSHAFEYLESKGYTNHVYVKTEQIIIGGGTLFHGDDGMIYGSITSELSEVILFRSDDNMATVEFFAVYPRQVQYEFDYKLLNNKIYAVYRTNHEKNANSFSVSEDNGITWSEPYDFEESIQCRPRLIVSNGKVIMAYNYFNGDSGNRPEVIMGRTAIRICTVDKEDRPILLSDLHSKYGIVNISLADVYPYVRGKDAVRYVKLGDLMQ